MFESFTNFFSSQGFMPHIHCYLGKPSLVWTMVITDLLIGLSYVSISLILWRLIQKIRIPFSAVVLCFGVFIAACGATHFMEIYTLWIPNYWASAWVKVITALASLGTAIYLFQLRGGILGMAEAARLSEQRRMELEVLTKNLEMRVGERTRELQNALELRDGFFSVASHELRTPITSLKLKTQMALRGMGVGTPEQNSAFVADVNSQVERLSKLVEDMLDIARYRGGSLPVSFDQQDLVEVVGLSLDRMAGQLDSAGIRVKREFCGNFQANIDRIRIEQVVGNLLANAIKYAPHAPLTVSIKVEGDMARLEVRDEGPGIAREHQERIFNRFEQVSPKNHLGGLGVGLFVSKAIIEAHEGSLKLESDLGKGAKFIITLPLHRKHGIEECVNLGQTE